MRNRYPLQHRRPGCASLRIPCLAVLCQAYGSVWGQPGTVAHAVCQIYSLLALGTSHHAPATGHRGKRPSRGVKRQHPPAVTLSCHMGYGETYTQPVLFKAVSSHAYPWGCISKVLGQNADVTPGLESATSYSRPISQSTFPRLGDRTVHWVEAVQC